MMLAAIALVVLVVAGVVIPMAIADSAERLGDEVRDWAECEEDERDN